MVWYKRKNHLYWDVKGSDLLIGFFSASMWKTSHLLSIKIQRSDGVLSSVLTLFAAGTAKPAIVAGTSYRYHHLSFWRRYNPSFLVRTSLRLISHAWLRLHISNVLTSPTKIIALNTSLKNASRRVIEGSAAFFMTLKFLDFPHRSCNADEWCRPLFWNREVFCI